MAKRDLPCSRKHKADHVSINSQYHPIQTNKNMLIILNVRAIDVISLGDAGQLERGFVLFLRVFLYLRHSSGQCKSLISGLAVRNDVGHDGNVVDLVFGDDIELVSELADDLGRSLDCHNHFPGHAHGDLHRIRFTGPISLSCTFTWMLLGRFIVMRCEITSSFFISIFN